MYKDVFLCHTITYSIQVSVCDFKWALYFETQHIK